MTCTFDALRSPYQFPRILIKNKYVCAKSKNSRHKKAKHEKELRLASLWRWQDAGTDDTIKGELLHVNPAYCHGNIALDRTLKFCLSPSCSISRNLHSVQIPVVNRCRWASSILRFSQSRVLLSLPYGTFPCINGVTSAPSRRWIIFGVRSIWNEFLYSSVFRWTRLTQYELFFSDTCPLIRFHSSICSSSLSQALVIPLCRSVTNLSVCSDWSAPRILPAQSLTNSVADLSFST